MEARLALSVADWACRGCRFVTGPEYGGFWSVGVTEDSGQEFCAGETSAVAFDVTIEARCPGWDAVAEEHRGTVGFEGGEAREPSFFWLGVYPDEQVRTAGQPDGFGGHRGGSP